MARRNLGKALGFRSGLEATVAQQLVDAGVPVKYEAPESVIRYTVPSRMARYTPDFELPNGIIIETKGRFMAGDRKKHELIHAEFPDKDIRFVFTNPNARINATSKTTNAAWCEARGFRYAKGLIPPAWLEERKRT